MNKRRGGFRGAVLLGAAVVGLLAVRGEAQAQVAVAGGVFSSSTAESIAGWRATASLSAGLSGNGWIGVRAAFGQLFEESPDRDWFPSATAVVGLDLPIEGKLTPYVFGGAGLIDVNVGYLLGAGLDLDGQPGGLRTEFTFEAAGKLEVLTLSLGYSFADSEAD